MHRALLVILLPIFAYSADRPNVVFILMDDFGLYDVGFNGATYYETPRLDQFAKASMRFNFCYAASTMCSPTRASIMTGKAPARHGITQWLPGDMNHGQKLDCPTPFQYLKKSETTLAEALKANGYRTAFMGKWHMGKLKYARPTDHGFDSAVAVIETNRCQMFPPYGRNKRAPKYFKNPKPNETFTSRLTSEAVSFLKRDHKKPFFLYLSHFAMHYPIAAKKELRQRFEKKATVGTNAKPDSHSTVTLNQVRYSAEYAGELFDLDANIGRVIDTLEESGQLDNTIVIITGDNGGRVSTNKDNPTAVAPLRGGKTFLYEGGLRVPTLIHWPGRTAPGSASDVPVTSVDFYPTILEMLQLPPAPEQHQDGLSLVPLITKTPGAIHQRDSLYWHFPHYQREGSSPASAIRVGDYKLIVNYHHGDVELFDLKKDPNETTNLASSLPEKTAALKKKLDAYLKETGAGLPILAKKAKQ